MKQAIKLGVLCALLFSGTMLGGVEAATLKKVVSPRSNRLAQAEVAPKHQEQVLAQAGCVIPGSGSGGACNIPEGVRSALSSELAQMGIGSSPVLDCNVCGIPPVPPPPVGSPPTPPPTLGAGVIATQEVSALSSQLAETNTFDDHRCESRSCAEKCEDTCESKAAFGCGCRKRTVCLEGDICYRNIKFSSEAGQAVQQKESCEEELTTTTSALTAIEAPLPCVTVIACPPGSEE
jgi:hypothetical protein